MQFDGLTPSHTYSNIYIIMSSCGIWRAFKPTIHDDPYMDVSTFDGLLFIDVKLLTSQMIAERLNMYLKVLW